MREHLVKREKLICFSRWTRKSYAVFNSLKKQIKISSLAIALLNISFITTVDAQQDTTKQLLKEHQLEEVEVIGQKAPVVFSESSRVVTIISRKEIESSPARSISDILQYVAGIDLRQRGSNDVQSDINLRGGGFDQSLILLDGIPVNDPQTGHHSMDLPVSLEQIERIEILKGPGSRVLGPNAYSGAINIISRKAHKKELDFQLKAGDFGSFESNLSLSLPGKKTNSFVAFNTSGSDGYRHNTDFRKNALHYSASYKHQNHQFGFLFSSAIKSFGANSFYSAKYPDQYEETKTLISGLQHEWRGKVRIKSSLNYRLHFDRFDLFRQGIAFPVWYKNPNFHLNQSVSINSVASFTSKLGKSAFGIDYRYEDIQSNVLGILMSDTLRSFLDEKSFFTKYEQRTYFSAYAEHTWIKSRFSASVGLMANYNSFQQKFNLFPGLDASFKILSSLKWFASFNSSLRLPTFTDLYYQGPTNTGNPNLKPETSKSIESGFRFSKKFVESNVSFYYSEGKNTIDWIRKNTTEKWQAQNVTSLKSYGYEASVLLKPGNIFANYIGFIEFSFGQNRIHKYSGEWMSNYSMDYLLYKFSLKIHHKIYQNLSADWAFRTQDRNGDYLKYDKITNSETAVSYQAFSVMDLKLNYDWKNWKFFAGAQNLLDVKYIDFGNIPQSGRWIYGGISYKIPLNQRVTKT